MKYPFTLKLVLKLVIVFFALKNKRQIKLNEKQKLEMKLKIR